MLRIVSSRAPTAVLRAGVMALLVVWPHLTLGHGPSGTAQLVALFAVMAGLFTFSEYVARAPSIVEFRDARPYNRIRFASLALAVLLTCVLLRPFPASGLLASWVQGLGRTWGELLYFPWSPVRLLVGTLPAGTSAGLRKSVCAAAAVAYSLSLAMVLLFACVVRLRNWPGRTAFNVWINLPQFDPTAGGDVVGRLQRDAQVNLVLGLFLPFLAPLVADLLSGPFDGLALREPSALVWMVMAWAFIPSSLAMRGLALNRLAWMIAVHRARMRRGEGLPQAA